MHAKKIYEIIDKAIEEERERIALEAIEKFPCYINDVRDAVSAHENVSGNSYFLLDKVVERNKNLVEVLDRFRRNKFIVFSSNKNDRSGIVFRKQKNKIVTFEYDKEGIINIEEFMNLHDARLWNKYTSKAYHIPEPKVEKEIVVSIVSLTRGFTSPDLAEV